MLEEKLGQYYETIATNVIDLILEPWNKIYFFCEVRDYLYYFDFYYDDKNGHLKKRNFSFSLGLEEAYSDSVTREIYKEIRALKDDFLENQQCPWDTFCFELNSDGAFKAHYEYDLPEPEIHKFYQIRWEYKTLGIKDNFKYLTEDEIEKIVNE
ncbi:MAG: DUF600 family protein [Veillonella sp.]|nr:DUF600 family protein [Veillonella sp.]